MSFSQQHELPVGIWRASRVAWGDDGEVQSNDDNFGNNAITRTFKKQNEAQVKTNQMIEKSVTYAQSKKVSWFKIYAVSKL